MITIKVRVYNDKWYFLKVYKSFLFLFDICVFSERYHVDDLDKMYSKITEYAELSNRKDGEK